MADLKLLTLACICAAAITLVRGEKRQNHTNRPGADPGANTGATVNDPATSTAPNARREPAGLGEEDDARQEEADKARREKEQISPDIGTTEMGPVEERTQGEDRGQGRRK